MSQKLAVQVFVTGFGNLQAYLNVPAQPKDQAVAVVHQSSTLAGTVTPECVAVAFDGQSCDLTIPVQVNTTPPADGLLLAHLQRTSPPTADGQSLIAASWFIKDAGGNVLQDSGGYKQGRGMF